MTIQTKRYYQFKCDCPFCDNVFDVESTTNTWVQSPYGYPWQDAKDAGWTFLERTVYPPFHVYAAMPFMVCQKCTREME